MLSGIGSGKSQNRGFRPATIYTPPSAVEVPIMMSEMVKWLNSDLEIHPVLISGIAQFQLVHIHPFLDGNGR
ncbi:MAG: Fic family protein, partial [Thermodesulfobacteriota bacterium]